MKFNFKKITPILASAVLLGSTIGFATVAADLASYPSPFVSGGAADISIVYGVDGMAKDMEAAGLFSSDLASELADQTATTSSSSTSMAGESTELATTSTKLYMFSELDTARPTLTKSELPTLLANGKVLDDAGTEYTYTQKIDMADRLNRGRNISFGKSGEAIDPTAMLDIGYSASLPIYNYTIAFNKNLNVSHADVQGNTISLLGNDYTIGASSDYNLLYLYGTGTKVTVAESEEKTVTVAGTDHTIQLEGTDSATTGVMIFDGVRKSVTEGSSYKFAGEIEVYVKDIFHQTKTGVSSSAEFSVGSTKLKLDAAGTVKKGSDETSILNTIVTITPVENRGGGKISGFSVAQASGSAIGDYLKIGEGFTDRVFGNVKIDFSALTPALDSTLRDEVIVDTDNSANAKVTFTTAIAGKPFTMNFGHDIDADGSNTKLAVKLADTANYSIHVVENESININEYLVVDAGDKGRILRLTAIGSGTSQSDLTKFEDVITGESFPLTTGLNNYSDFSLDGNIYKVQVNNPGSNPQNVTVNWGTGAAYNTPGYVSVFPRIKLAKGGWLAFLTEAYIRNATTVILPGSEVLSTHEAGALVAGVYPNNEPSIKYGNINWTLTNTSRTYVDTQTTMNWSIVGINADSDAWEPTTDCNFSSPGLAIVSDPAIGSVGAQSKPTGMTQGPGPAILLIEEHKLGEVNGDAVCVPLTSTGTNELQVAVGTPVNTDAADMGGAFTFNTLTSNSYKSQAVDIYGTFVERDTTSGTNYRVTLKYPDEQMLADVFVAEVAAEATVSEISAGVTKLGDVILSDDEAETSKPKDNLIVVGGSAVNKVAAKLLDVTYPTYGSDAAWQDATGVTAEGQAIIKLFASPYSADKKAMLIAGYEADDTVAAAKQVINKKTTLADLDEKVIKKGVDWS